VPSSELVPGDVYEVTDHALTQFPCDSILLAGDCIVNESMLTGMNYHLALFYKV
jgi:cation-transporting ATPase 13A2